jgi:predicted DsbA family dithiol-disulfide isomerase
MSMAKLPMSFRFSEEFVTLLKTWAFVSGKEQRQILEEAFQEYMEQRPDIADKVLKIIETMNDVP